MSVWYVHPHSTPPTVDRLPTVSEARQTVQHLASALRCGRIDRGTWASDANAGWRRKLDAAASSALRRAVRDYVSAYALASQRAADHFDDCQCRTCSLAWCDCGERAYDSGDRSECYVCSAIRHEERRGEF